VCARLLCGNCPVNLRGVALLQRIIKTTNKQGQRRPANFSSAMASQVHRWRPKTKRRREFAILFSYFADTFPRALGDQKRRGIPVLGHKASADLSEHQSIICEETMKDRTGIKGRGAKRVEAFALKRSYAKVLIALGLMPLFPVSQAAAQAGAANQEEVQATQQVAQANQQVAQANQEQAPAAKDAPQATGQLEQVIVTAQKRPQAAQTAPVAITAISGDSLVKAGVQTSNDIADMTSGLKISPVFGTGNIPNIAIRGVGLNDFRDYNESPSAVYVDEVYKGALASLDFQLFDVGRVEVLKGPQGTLFGRNATGGLIHYITQKPTYEFESFVRGSGGSYGDLNLEAAIGGPITESVATRLSVMMRRNDGIQQNQNTAPGAEDANQVDLKAVRGQLNFDISKGSSLLVSVESSSNRNKGGNPYRYAPSFIGSDGLAQVDEANRNVVVGTSNLNDINVSPGLYVNSDYNAGTARLNVGLGGVELISITNAQNFKKRQRQDCDSAPADFCFTLFDSNTHQFSQEFRLEGGGAALKWNVGLYYFDLKTDGSQALTGPVAGFFFGTPSGTTAFDTQTKSWAAFSQVDYKLTDSLSVIGGLRYTDDKKDMSQTFLLGVIPGGVVYDSSTIGDLAKQKNTDTSYLAKLVWTPTRDTLVYGGVSSGYKAGTFNSGFAPIALDAYSVKPEKLTSYEVGFKSEFDNRRHRLNGALFHYDYKDYQAFVFRNLDQLLFNADAKIDGAELEYSGYWTKSLLVSAGVAFLNTKVKNVQDGSGAIYDRKMVLAPDFAANAMARYTVDLANGGNLAFQLDANYSSSVYFDNLNQPGLKEGPSYQLNGRVSWIPVKSWELAAWAKNMTNQVYRIYAFDLTQTLGYIQEAYHAPRTIGASLTKTF
jgi:iron complex outermembrane receptor protein